MQVNSCRFYPENILYILLILLDIVILFLNSSVSQCLRGGLLFRLVAEFRQQKTHSGKGQNGSRNRHMVISVQMMLQAHL